MNTVMGTLKDFYAEELTRHLSLKVTDALCVEVCALAPWAVVLILNSPLVIGSWILSA